MYVGMFSCMHACVYILTYTHRHLHDYLIPIELVTLDFLPTDPGSLPIPTLKGLLHEYVPPSSPTEAIIQEIWAEVLGGAPPSVHADFFEHGGTSLLAGRLIAKVRAWFWYVARVRVGVRDECVSAHLLVCEYVDMKKLCVRVCVCVCIYIYIYIYTYIHTYTHVYAFNVHCECLCAHLVDVSVWQ